MPTPIFTVTVSDAANTPFELVAFTGREAISQLFQFELTLKLPNAVAKDLKPDTIIHAPIELQVQYSATIEETTPAHKHIIRGFVQSMHREYKSSATHHYYRAVMVPNAAIMGKNQTYDIFEDANVKDILTKKLEENGVSFTLANVHGQYFKRHFVCQYAESDFDFIARQAAYWGIRFHINHMADKNPLEFTDGVLAAEGSIGKAKLVDVCSTDNRYSSVYDLRCDYETVVEKVTVSETSANEAASPINAEQSTNENSKYSLHLTNEGCDNENEAKFIAKIRLEEQQTYRTRFQGATGIPVLTPGFILTVECNGQKERILITEVQHRANNLDTQTRAAANSDGDYYEAIFVGIPADHQYRPAYSQQMRPRVISTTARIYAAGFKEESKKEKSENSHSMIAERNDLGMYRVVFDFMLARKEDTVRPSNWMRLARPTARTNHFDMPLTPGTEVQVAFIDGNPDRPYIQCALENSRSLITPVSNKNPHHAAILTDGMLKTEALKSRQSLHISGQYHAKPVKDFLSASEFDALAVGGENAHRKIDRLEGNIHIKERFGDQYVRKYGSDFVYGVNATYRFGQKYEEVHANIDPVTNKYFTSIGSEVFNFNDKLLGRDNSKDSGDGFDHHRMYSNEFINGIIRKEFGNKYSYHKGIESTWVEGADSAVQQSYHYGKRHVEYHADLNASPVNTDPENLGDGFTTDIYGDVTENVQGAHNEGHTGDYTLTRTGKTEETRTGDVTRTIIGNVNESIENGSVTINNNLMGKTVTEMMPAGDYKTEVTAMNYETTFVVNGERKEMDMSLKSTKLFGGLLDVTYAQPRTINDINPFSEIFLGVKNGFVAGMSSDVKLGVTVDYRKSIHFSNENQRVIDTKIALRKCGQSIQKASQIVVLCSCLMLA